MHGYVYIPAGIKIPLTTHLFSPASYPLLTADAEWHDARSTFHALLTPRGTLEPRPTLESYATLESRATIEEQAEGEAAQARRDQLHQELTEIMHSGRARRKHLAAAAAAAQAEAEAAAAAEGEAAREAEAAAAVAGQGAPWVPDPPLEFAGGAGGGRGRWQ